MISTVRACMVSIQDLTSKGPSPPDEAEERRERQMEAYGLGGRHLDEEAFRDRRALIIGRYISCGDRTKSVYYTLALQRDQMKRVSTGNDGSVHSNITAKVRNTSKKPRRKRYKSKASTALNTVQESCSVSVVASNQQKGLLVRQIKQQQQQPSNNNLSRGTIGGSGKVNGGEGASGSGSKGGGGGGGKGGVGKVVKSGSSGNEVMNLTQHVAEMTGRQLFHEMTKQSKG